LPTYSFLGIRMPSWLWLELTSRKTGENSAFE
jgi:hypothetical protein